MNLSNNINIIIIFLNEYLNAINEIFNKFKKEIANSASNYNDLKKIFTIQNNILSEEIDKIYETFKINNSLDMDIETFFNHLKFLNDSDINNKLFEIKKIIKNKNLEINSLLKPYINISKLV